MVACIPTSCGAAAGTCVPIGLACTPRPFDGVVCGCNGTAYDDGTCGAHSDGVTVSHAGNCQ